jgi:hypothetical protein
MKVLPLTPAALTTLAANRHGCGTNPGIVPPWLQHTTPTIAAPTLWDPKPPVAPIDPDLPRIM